MVIKDPGSKRGVSFATTRITPSSGPGLFTVEPPYSVDQQVVAYVDELLEKIADAGLFAAISFRTGPGRIEHSLCCGGDSYYDGYFNESVWDDRRM